MSPIWNNIFFCIMWVTYVIIYFSLWNRGNNIYFDFLHVLNLEIWKGKNHEHKDAWTHTLGPKSVEWTNQPWVWTSKKRLNQKKMCEPSFERVTSLIGGKLHTTTLWSCLLIVAVYWIYRKLHLIKTEIKNEKEQKIYP